MDIYVTPSRIVGPSVLQKIIGLCPCLAKVSAPWMQAVSLPPIALPDGIVSPDIGSPWQKKLKSSLYLPPIEMSSSLDPSDSAIASVLPPSAPYKSWSNRPRRYRSMQISRNL